MPTVTTISNNPSLDLIVQWIKRLIVEGSKDPLIQDMVQQLKDNPKAVQIAFNWIWENIAFVADPPDKQNLKTVHRILKDCSANCANYCVILGAFLYAIGETFYLRAVSYSDNKSPEHIYIVWDGLPLDLTLGKEDNTGPLYGQQWPSFTFKKDFFVSPLTSSGRGRTNYVRTCCS